MELRIVRAYGLEVLVDYHARVVVAVTEHGELVTGGVPRAIAVTVALAVLYGEG